MPMTEHRCFDCGADVSELTCAELFDELLALDHGRRQPWGGLHGEAVAAYFLDHPAAARAPRDTTPLRERLQRFLDTPATPAGPLAPTTIHDVAVDGTFPAAGYEDRLRAWARWVLGRRGQRSS